MSLEVAEQTAALSICRVLLCVVVDHALRGGLADLA